MPDLTLAESFLATAEALVPEEGNVEDQGTLRRSLSTAYYALFHSFARCFATALVGAPSTESNHAWVEIYRALDHTACNDACKKANTIGFPDDIKNAADGFKQLQEARHRADYDPKLRLTHGEVRFYVGLAKDCIAAVDRPDRRHKIAFASWVLITGRGAREARKRAKLPNERSLD